MVHWTNVLIAAVLAATIFTAAQFMHSEGIFDFRPLLGCGVVLLGVIVTLCILLAKAWGWI